MTPDEIRKLRADLQMTAAEFGARVGVEWRAVQRWEAGDRTPRGPALVLMRQMREGLDAGEAAKAKAKARARKEKP